MYHCTCPEEFTGEDCQLKKCFDNSLYEFFDVGVSWSRVQHGAVEQCSCVNGQMECGRVEHKSCIHNPCMNGGECKMVASTGKIVCDCKENYAGKYCNIGDKMYKALPILLMALMGTIVLLPTSQSLPLPVPSHRCYIGNGTDYRGTAKTTISGHSCLPWNSDLLYQELHVDSIGKAVQLGLGPFPYCRNPDDDDKPWCYIMKDNSLSWAYCDIPTCVSRNLNILTKRISPLKSTIRVVLGQQIFNKTTDVTQTFEIEKYILHPQYSVFNPTEHDIALIKLKKNGQRCAVKSQFVQPICLPESNTVFPDQLKCQISGWGHKHENVLQETLVPLISEEKCRSPEIYGTELTENMFCAGYFDSKSDACQGDSGGPLACEENDISYLYGIISWGDGCGRPNKPGVYTRVTNYVKWINEKIAPRKTS
ncbi:Hepatocyte growth factor activator [Lonchura striata]|uniref:Hepatocyte growth factor activator n=1 Tax=Lonchura striata TaxID=40157 RepID=A0A218V1Z1_9PASE|nr:Hepatocyte growth factor activator [Lonchura striata domestica]